MSESNADEPEIEAHIDLPTPPSDAVAKPLPMADAPIVFLGFSGEHHYYMSRDTHVVKQLTPASHTSLVFMDMAPLEWFTQMFPGKGDGAVNWMMAANAMMRFSQRAGMYDANKVRGRGCWIDKGRVVQHAGDHLRVDGTKMALSAFKSEYIYEQGYPIAPDEEPPLSNEEAAKLIPLFGMLSYKSPLAAKLFCGWCVIAPICGALDWRPHGWLDGASGSGKSWFMHHVVRPLLGKGSLFVQGNTSEAGLRGCLELDAFPVMFDESEAENQKSTQRLQAVLELARQASSESGGAILKGRANGGSVKYEIKSCFLFASIGVSATQRADTSRITRFSILKRTDAEKVGHFRKLKEMVAATVSIEKWCAGLRARTVQLAAIIRQNALTFADAAAEKLGDKRLGDQIGPMLAGCYSLTSRKLITAEAAAKWVSEQDWTGFVEAAGELDETRCLNFLLECHIRQETDGGGSVVRTVGELIQDALENTSAGEAANDVLMRYGIKVKPNGALPGWVDISCQHKELAHWFRDTPWPRNWNDQYSRIEGAKRPGSAVWFCGVRSRVVRIPAGIFEMGAPEA